MTPYLSDVDFTLYVGDVTEVLAGLPDESVHCVVTSPPYYSLRDYGVAGQLGLEATLDEYVAAMVGVFRDVRRVLRRGGSLWLNLGDAYAANRSYQVADSKHKAHEFGGSNAAPIPAGLKPKDLLGVPWRVAFALQADGWYLRSEIIWAKPNPMPESVTDRPTKAHEQVFLLTRSPRYFFDADAVREPHSPDGRVVTSRTVGSGSHANYQEFGHEEGRERWPNGGRNLRSVWEIATQPYPEAHFATFPEALVERCVKAGTSERGCCPVCGAPWERETERDTSESDREPRGKALTSPRNDGSTWNENNGRGFMPVTVATTGWKPTCGHDREPVPCTVADIFMGSGTTALVARNLGRHSIGIELNEQYAQLAARRLSQQSLLTEVS